MGRSPPHEIELKLRADPADFARLRDSRVIRTYARCVGQSSDLSSIYYDTADRRLSQRGLALRVRRDGRRLIQTLKGAVDLGSGAFRRPEWEVELDSPRPDLAAFGDPDLIETIGLILPDELQPVFETRIRRDTVLLEWPQGRDAPTIVEVAFDEGSIIANGAVQALAELELELKEGRPEALFSIAAALRDEAPLAIETQDKAGRGFRLATGESAASRKPGAVELPRDCSVEAGLATILRHGFAHWLDNEAAALHGASAEGVHQIRVALRRLRSALSIFREVVAPETRTRWDEAFRSILRSLAPARDLDVLLGELLPPLEGDAELCSHIRPLRRLAEGERAAAYTAVRQTLSSARYADLTFDFAAWIERQGWREAVDVDVLLAQRRPLLEFAQRNLKRRHRQALKRGKGFEGLSPAARHKVRIALKELRYGVEFFAELFERKRVKPFARRLMGFQGELGALNDVAEAGRLVRDLIGHARTPKQRQEMALAAGGVIGWHSARLQALEPAVIAGWERFRKVEPFWAAGR
jgi:triphosphatase